MTYLLLVFTSLLSLAHAEVAEPDYTVDVAAVERVDLSINGPQREDRIRTLLRTSNEAYGTNCWNTALNVSGLIDSNHYTSGSEFWHWMNSPFCKAVPKDEPLRYGDIGSVFSQAGGHYHSFMRVNDDVIFQKAGPEVDQKWEYVKTEKIVFPKYYDLIKSCKGNESKQEKKNCDLAITYSRCQPIPTNFYSKHEGLGQIEHEIKKAEKQMLAWAKTHDPKERKNFDAAMARLHHLLGQLQLNENKFTGEKEFARQALAYRIAGNLTTDADQYEKMSPKVKAAIDAGLTYNELRDRNLFAKDVDRSTWRSFSLPSRNAPAADNVRITDPTKAPLPKWMTAY